MGKVNFKAKMATDIDEKTWQLDIDQIDEINSNVNFVIAVLDAIAAMGLVSGNAEIKGKTLLHLASEAEESMKRIKKIINAQ